MGDCRVDPPHELAHEPRLADARHARDRHQLATLLRANAGPRLVEHPELSLAPYERRVEAAGGSVGRDREQPPRRHRFALALQLERLDRLGRRGFSCETDRPFADQDLARLRSLLEPRRRRDGAAGHEPLVRPDDNLAALDADPAFDPELRDRVPHLHGRPQRAQCIVLVHRRHPEHGHHRVPDELLDHAPMAFRSRLHLLEVRRQQSAQRLRIERLSELGGVGDVREKHGHDLPLRPSDHLGLRRARRLGAPCPDRVRRRLGRHRGWGRVERWILHKDRLLEALQSLARVEAELVAQRRARFLHHGERVRLATGAVQGEHQQLAQPLAQRVVADERLQLGDRLAVRPTARSASRRCSSATRRSSSSRPISSRANAS